MINAAQEDQSRDVKEKFLNTWLISVFFFIHLETSAEGKKAGRMLSSPACPHHHVADWHWLPIVLQ